MNRSVLKRGFCSFSFFFSSEGFNRVFPMEKLSSFSHKEVQMILCGNQSPSWTADDIINYTEPKLGYTRDRYWVSYLYSIVMFLKMEINCNLPLPLPQPWLPAVRQSFMWDVV